MYRNAEKDLEILLDIAFAYKRTEAESASVRNNAKKVASLVSEWSQVESLSPELEESADDVYTFFSSL